jgi:5-(carboxyamino)imidazole ribonucleotide synthase
VILGVLGGGQLGRMLALAGLPLGWRFVFVEPAPEATRGLGELIEAPASDPRAVAALAERADVVTYEFENVSVAAVRTIAQRRPVRPTPAALELAQDRVVEKRFFGRLEIPTAPFVPVETREELARAAEQVGLPAVLKTRRLGYDGKGQRVLRTRRDLAAAEALVEAAPCILEGHVAFERELSIVAVRGAGGALAFYPLVENHHADGILRRTIAPAPDVSPALAVAARGIATRVAERLEYVGVLTVELFQVGETLLANEMAPRVHNSGHWTIDAAETSQFENHVRAVAGWPLGPTDVREPAVMLNCIGDLPDPARVLAVPRAHLHLYGKAPRPGRKVAHVTVRGATVEDADGLVLRLGIG